ncbi:hypothetical protein HPLT_04760 [Helicobacter pylori Lithuania75]|nr:hypothetical protein HPLT_04760 [Helicobacter pylori Lithuania75]
MISVQKVNHFIFFIIKHGLNEFKFCFTRFVKTLYLIVSATKTLL